MVAAYEDDAPRALAYQAGRAQRCSTAREAVASRVCVGVDWAEAQHAVCLVNAAGVVVRRLTIPHTAAEPSPAAVLVAIERPDGLLVAGLLAAGDGV